MTSVLPYKQTIIIIPTYNEAENIKDMIEAIYKISPLLSILTIDDSSPDGTYNIITDLISTFSSLHLIKREGKSGLGTAYTEGFKWALQNNYQYIIQMDSDFSHNPSDIPKLLESAMSYDLSIGSRYIGGTRTVGWSAKRLFLSRFASIYARIITGIKLHDPLGGFKCFNNKALKKINLDNILSSGFSFQLEINYKITILGMKITEIPITFHERSKGKSKMNFSIIFEAFYTIILLRISHLLGKL